MFTSVWDMTMGVIWISPPTKGLVDGMSCLDISSVDTTMDPTSITTFPREGFGICKFNNCKYFTEDNISELTCKVCGN